MSIIHKTDVKCFTNEFFDVFGCVKSNPEDTLDGPPWLKNRRDTPSPEGFRMSAASHADGRGEGV